MDNGKRSTDGKNFLANTDDCCFCDRLAFWTSGRISGVVFILVFEQYFLTKSAVPSYIWRDGISILCSRKTCVLLETACSLQYVHIILPIFGGTFQCIHCLISRNLEGVHDTSYAFDKLRPTSFHQSIYTWHASWGCKDLSVLLADIQVISNTVVEIFCNLIHGRTMKA